MPKTPRLVANITTLTWDAPLLVRPSLARDFGFDAVECLFPYDHSLAAWDRALTASGSEMVLVNTAENQWERGARGCAAVPGATARFMTQFAIARTYARHLGVGCIHVMAGRTTDPAAFDTFVKNLRLAADWTPDRRLTIEPLNPGDMPGYFLGDFALAARILDAVDRSNVGLQFDAWHASRIHGNARQVWADYGHRATHVQIAGLEKRGAPNMARAEEAALLRDILQSGYNGNISAEFTPWPDDPPDWIKGVQDAFEEYGNQLN